MFLDAGENAVKENPCPPTHYETGLRGIDQLAIPRSWSTRIFLALLEGFRAHPQGFLRTMAWSGVGGLDGSQFGSATSVPISLTLPGFISRRRPPSPEGFDSSNL